jgi:hypothetical protein
MILLPLGIANAQEQTGMEPAQAAPANEPSSSQAAPSTEAAPAETQAQPADTAEQLPEQSGFSRGSVVRSVFTTAVEDREPVDKIKTLDNSHRQIYYFTELRDMSGQTATHRWEYNGKVMAEVKFNVGGPRWRVWSTKTLVPGWTGEWKVSVLNGAGEVISEDAFEYTEAPAASDTSADESQTDTGAASDAGMEQDKSDDGADSSGEPAGAMKSESGSQDTMDQ